MDRLGVVGVCLIVLPMKNTSAFGEDGETIDATDLKSENLCRQCSICESSKCPPSKAYPTSPHFDDSLIAAALQSDYVPLRDRGVNLVSHIKVGQSMEYNAYFGWNSSCGSASGHDRFSNYMDKCSKGQSYLTVDEHGIWSLSSPHSLVDADWKSVHPPKKLNLRGFQFWVSHSTGKCLTIFKGKSTKQKIGVADCKFDGSNLSQLFAFCFHYHKAFCCCGIHNN